MATTLDRIVHNGKFVTPKLLNSNLFSFSSTFLNFDLVKYFQSRKLSDGGK